MKIPNNLNYSQYLALAEVGRDLSYLMFSYIGRKEIYFITYNKTYVPVIIKRYMLISSIYRVFDN